MVAFSVFQKTPNEEAACKAVGLYGIGLPPTACPGLERGFLWVPPGRDNPILYLGLHRSQVSYAWTCKLSNSVVKL